MGMASFIKKGESIFIPFRNGQSISDSQLKPRMYKTEKAFVKSFPGHYPGTASVELVEYAEVVRCKDCKHYWLPQGFCTHDRHDHQTMAVGQEDDDFCSYGERRGDTDV